MKFKKLIAMGLAASMLLGTTAAATFAADDSVIMADAGEDVWFEETVGDGIIMEEPAEDVFFDDTYFEEDTLPEETVTEDTFFEEETVGAAEEAPAENPAEEVPAETTAEETTDDAAVIEETTDETVQPEAAEVAEDSAVPASEEESAETAPAGDPMEAMHSLIDTAVAECEGRGLYAALDNTFITLAENADALTDPENGITRVDGNAVISATYEALAANFDNSPEELYGAIGAAAARADDMGLIDEMMENGALKSMAVQEKDNSRTWKEAKKFYKATYEGALDGLAGAFPALRAVLPFLKLIGGYSFDDESGNNDMAEIRTQLDEIMAEIKDTKTGLEEHMYNVVAISDIGNEMGSVKAKAETIRTRISNIRRNNLPEEEKTRQIAELYTDSEFQALESAVNGGTECFFSSKNTIFKNRNIFDAAYATACETVMFSQEAIEVSVPYLLEQIADYTAAYSIMSEVYDEYEKVYGANSLLECREKQAKRLYGMDLSGNRIGDSVNDLFGTYLKRDKYIFVNGNNSTNIALSTRIIAKANINREIIVNDRAYSNWCKTPDYMSNMPLNASQVKNLAAYCAKKKITIFDFLFNRMGFVPDALSASEKKDPKKLALQPFEADYLARPVTYYPKGRAVTGNVCLLTGAQEVSKNRPGGGSAWLSYEAVNAAKVGAASETVRMQESRIEARGNMYPRTSINNTLLFFQAR